MSISLGERLLEGVDIGHVGEHAKLDLRIVGAETRRWPSAATKAPRILRPSSVRIGMFCRLGSFERQPPGRGRGQHVGGVHAAGLGHDLLDQRIRCRCRSASAAGASRASPAAARGPGPPAPRARRHRWHRPRSWSCCRRRCPCSSNRISPSCLGEPRLKGRPASLMRLLLALGHALAEDRPRGVSRWRRSTDDPGRLHGGEDGDQRPLQGLVDGRRAAPRSAAASRDARGGASPRILGGVVRGLLDRHAVRSRSASRPCRRRPRTGSSRGRGGASASSSMPWPWPAPSST